jgi:hypothetical protein
VNIVDRTRIEFPCPSCGERYPLSLAQVLLSQAILHEGCQARAEDECPPDFFAPLLDHATIMALQRAWASLEEQVTAAGGVLLIGNSN